MQHTGRFACFAHLKIQFGVHTCLSHPLSLTASGKRNSVRCQEPVIWARRRTGK